MKHSGERYWLKTGAQEHVCIQTEKPLLEAVPRELASGLYSQVETWSYFSGEMNGLKEKFPKY